MSATTAFSSAPSVGRGLSQHAQNAAPSGNPGALMSLTERWTLGTQLVLAMVACWLLMIALVWKYLISAGSAVPDLAATGAALLVAPPVLSAALTSLRHPSLHGLTDQIVAVAMLASWASGDLLTAALLPIVMIIGHVFEERSLLGSQEAIRALERLVDTTSLRLNPDGTTEDVTASQLVPGDCVELRPGDRVPADGLILAGHSSLDMASLTGESVPVEVVPGERVLAGTISLSGVLTVEITRVGGETALGQIIALMEVAEEARPPLTRLLERYAGRYMALIMTISAAVWFASGSTSAMLAVLVASCPCAVVLAAPAASIAAIAVAARHGILIRGTAFLEHLADVTSLVIDKTGTLTTGRLSLERVITAPGVAEADLLSLGATLGSLSAHPVSRALARSAVPLSKSTFSDVQEEHGLGLRAVAQDGSLFLMGRPALLTGEGIDPGPTPDHDGPVVCLSRNGGLMGWLLLSDTVRPEAPEAMRTLRDLGLSRQILLTGDRLSVAQRVGEKVGIIAIEAEVLPAGKMSCVLNDIEQGHLPLVVGDGINDALALRAGAIGIAMGAESTDVALSSADIVLMQPDLRRLGTAIRLSRRCRRTIQTNVAMGVGWTGILIICAAFNLLGAQGAVMAAVLHNASTLAGLANAGRLLRFDETGLPERKPSS
ncbi:heavy metal translocating P-type ATPase [Acetobacter sp.]|uniref:heavy metal translocating P-type ATPase n=1 Tax=Acetobacter sp. TaxID=440 RepID=UPI0025B92532|nr:cation-translocating P-type ATPase [Acetobacter sp.]MCH4092015.1 cation-translocating P-type ATPase [Acetobacter sp.]MCI1300731.1 cation-translocating P-type ATPase [Acetobacter sp.]MCI1317517.1 cation-translocating P-type ATPase [Acetobacter sp.]